MDSCLKANRRYLPGPQIFKGVCGERRGLCFPCLCEDSVMPPPALSRCSEEAQDGLVPRCPGWLSKATLFSLRRGASLAQGEGSEVLGVTLKRKNISPKDCWTNPRAKAASSRLYGLFGLGTFWSLIPQGQWCANLKESKLVLLQIKGLKSAGKEWVNFFTLRPSGVRLPPQLRRVEACQPHPRVPDDAVLGAQAWQRVEEGPPQELRTDPLSWIQLSPGGSPHPHAESHGGR